MKKHQIEVRPLLSVLSVAVLVVAMDVIIMPILAEFYLEASAALVRAYEFSVVLLVRLAGMFFARSIPITDNSVNNLESTGKISCWWVEPDLNWRPSTRQASGIAMDEMLSSLRV